MGAQKSKKVKISNFGLKALLFYADDIVSEQDCWVLDFGFWILDFEIFSDLNFEF